MLKLGAQGAAALRLGSKAVKKAYLGDGLVFGAGKPSRLPEGYVEVEYIQSSGYCYIDTLARPTVTTLKLEMDVEPIAATGVGYFFRSYLYKPTPAPTWYVFGCQYTSTYIRASMGKYTEGQTQYKTIDSAPTAKRMSILYDMPAKSISIDGITTTFANNTVFVSTSQPTIKLLGYGSANYLTAKLYSCKLYRGTNSSLILDFVPCIDPSGASGLYDLVEGKFYANSGTGTFIAGPAV